MLLHFNNWHSVSLCRMSCVKIVIHSGIMLNVIVLKVAAPLRQLRQHSETFNLFEAISNPGLKLGLDRITRVSFNNQSKG